jgi:hypothetical protein
VPHTSVTPSTAANSSSVPPPRKTPGVVIPRQPKVGIFHSTPCKFNRKWVGILCNREATGAGWPP